MTITLDPKTEALLRTLAEKEHLSVEICLNQMVERESGNRAGPAAPADGVAIPTLAEGGLQLPAKPRAKNLVELFADSPLKGSGIVIERDSSPLPERLATLSDGAI